MGAMSYLSRQHLRQDWLRGAIREYYERLGRPRWREPQSRLSPHAIYSPCPRAVQLRLLGYEPPVDPHSRLRMDNGAFVHERWTRAFQEMGLGVAGERLEGRDMVGTPDLILMGPDGEYLVELKSINSAGFRRLPAPSAHGPTNLTALARVQPGHVAQWLAYDLLLRENGRDIGRGFILYENKDTQDVRYFFVVRDEGLFERLARNAFLALEWLRRGDVIPPPYASDSAVCAACELRDACWRAAEGDAYMVSRLREALARLRGGGDADPG